MIIIVILIVILINPIRMFINKQNAISSEKYTVLQKGKSINSIQAKGEIQTLDDAGSVYADSSIQTLKIVKVNVEVGDRVNEGDVLATLDSSDLEKDIEESREKLNTSKNATSIQLKIKENAYNNLKDKCENNLNSSVNECEKKCTSC